MPPLLFLGEASRPGHPNRFLTLLLRTNKGLEWPSLKAIGVGGGWAGMRLLRK